MCETCGMTHFAGAREETESQRKRERQRKKEAKADRKPQQSNKWYMHSVHVQVEQFKGHVRFSALVFEMRFLAALRYCLHYIFFVSQFILLFESLCKLIRFR